MINWKALMAGILAIAVIGLISQFAFLVTATWLTVVKNRQEIEPQSIQTLMYSAGFIFALITTIPSGYITAYVSKTKVVIHCAIVGILATAVSLATSPGAEHATSKGLVFVVLGTGMVMLGGLLWQWRSKAANNSLDTSST